MEAVVSQVRQAIDEQRIQDLEPLMLPQVAIAPPEAPSQVVPRPQALDWLEERASSDVRVVSWRSVAQYGLLEIVTEGWPQSPPIESGRVTFNLHRFDSSGVQDAMRGDWQIDVIIPD